MAADRPPINRQPPPWGHTFVLEGNPLAHLNLHPVIRHPNTLHHARDAASPFTDSPHNANAMAGVARHHPPFLSPGLNVSIRK